MAAFQRMIVAVLGVALQFLACGCIIVPSGGRWSRNDGDHKRIDDEDFKVLHERQTARADVLARLGPPSFEQGGGRFLIYMWSTRDPVHFKIETMYGEGEEVNENEHVYFLALEFDDAGLLLHKRRRKDARMTGHPRSIDDVFF